MHLFRHPDEVSSDVRGGVIALGNFDGLHLGHQSVVGAALARARAEGRPAAVMTFEPHPRAVFKPDLPPFRLTPLRIKVRLLEAMGIDYLYAQHFDPAFASLSAEDFCRDILARRLGIAHVVVGTDYVFGHGREGDVAYLTAAGERHGFTVTAVPPTLCGEGEVVSSTRVREHLRQGRPDQAAALLGRPWEVEGRVEPGAARGRDLGFPTANLKLGEYLRPRLGVYAIRAGVDRGVETVWHRGVANLGKRPTFDDGDPLLEAHLFDFTGDLYHQHLRVALIAFLRPELAFPGLDALKAQIAEDVTAARRLLA
ncbi:bifunctional riboflavin kinase/FAD synthetase [Roseospirillum parvum]|uniref:Riboflavin biosynthesis protein n=1 Tax=Roseospirillum parvum TaxID=83401 RepID=A0A1G8EKN4_9PROT|nr:bifunctional riboflavin kinase/FAD synthetase [Roseospirillum parvum]SDH70437.1 riboflavin kinase / FMN adenylyltransferase [Roseospirillum parvum]